MMLGSFTVLIKKYGIRSAILLSLTNLFDMFVDYYFSIDTFDKIKPADINFGNHDVSGVTGYQGVSALSLFFLLRKLKKLGYWGSEMLFVDIGSGKGKALIIASCMGFKRSIGYEADRALVSVSRANISKISCIKSISVYEHFFTLDTLLPSSSVFFLYNPFSHDLAHSVINKILRSPGSLVITNNIPAVSKDGNVISFSYKSFGYVYHVYAAHGCA